MRSPARLIALGMAVLAVLGSSISPAPSHASIAATLGVSASEIVIGTSLPLSGVASSYSVLANAEKAYFDSVNAHGGLYGRKLRLVALDDQYLPSRTLDNVKSLVLARNVFSLLGVVGTDNNTAILPFITAQKVPLVMPLSGSSSLLHPFNRYVFPYLPTYTVEGKVLVDYAVKTLHAHKLAVFYQNDDFGKEGLASTTARAQKDGAQVVASASYGLTDVDLSAQVQQIQQAGPDAVILFAVPTSSDFFINAAASAGLNTKLLSVSIATDLTVIKALGSRANGVYYDVYMPDFNSSVPQILDFKKVLSSYGSPSATPLGPTTEVGVAAAQILVEGLRRAGRNLTRDSFIKALETLHNWNGGLAPHVTYSATHHEGPEGAYMAQVRNGVLVTAGSYEFP